MKLSEKIRTEISMEGLDDLADEVALLENVIHDLESFRDNFEEINLDNTGYLNGIGRLLAMARMEGLGMKTTRYVVKLYDKQFDKGHI